MIDFYLFLMDLEIVRCIPRATENKYFLKYVALRIGDRQFVPASGVEQSSITGTQALDPVHVRLLGAPPQTLGAYTAAHLL